MKPLKMTLILFLTLGSLSCSKSTTSPTSQPGQNGGDEQIAGEICDRICAYGCFSGCKTTCIYEASTNGMGLPNQVDECLTKSGGDCSCVPEDASKQPDVASNLPETRTHKGRQWQTVPPPGPFGQREAAKYCEDLELGGFADWRLPTVNELRQLVVGCPGREWGGSCKVAAPDCLGKECYTRETCGHCPEKEGPAAGCYWETGLWGGSCTDYWFFWSSSLFDRFTDHFWVVRFQGGGLFDDGVVGFNEELGEGNVRCVRTP